MKPVDGWEDRKMNRIWVMLVVGTLLGGCAGLNKTQNGALLGAGAGALGGQIIGGDTESTVLGTAIGAAGGALAGNYADTQDQRRNQAYNQGYNQGYHRAQQETPKQPIAYNQPSSQAPVGGYQTPQTDPSW